MSQINLSCGAALSIHVKIADSCRVIFKESDKETLVTQSSLSRSQLSSLCAEMRPLLEAFQSGLIPSEYRSPRGAGEALRRLHLGGRNLLYKLFNDPNKLIKASEICRRACPNWNQSGWDSSALAPQTIEFLTSVDYGLPIDLLPLFDPKKPDAAEKMEDLARIACTFLGFSAIVKRTFADTVTADRSLRIENVGVFPLKMFWDRRLPGAEVAKRFFQQNADHFDSKGGPWPDGSENSDPDLFCEELADFLGNPESSFDHQSRHPNDQVCYLFCHCDTTAENSGDYSLSLSAGKLFGRQRRVTLAGLRDALWQINLRNLEKGQEQTSRPLIFMNACGSAGLNPAAATSFPQLFLSENMGFLGFIGTEATVPDAFGSMFAEVFYRHFVGGLPLGRALHAARWHMLRKGKSPLGLLYTLYANPEIETRYKVSRLREILLKN